MSNEHTFDSERLIDTRTAAERLSKHPQCLADWRHQGRGPKYYKLGRSVRYRVSDIDNWINNQVIDPVSR